MNKKKLQIARNKIDQLDNEIYEVEDDPIKSMYDKETKKAFLVA